MSKPDIGMSPSCWGSSQWQVLHSIAYVYNPQTDKDKYYNFLWNLGDILPCKDCKMHYYQNVTKLDLDLALSSNETLFRWIYDLHNKVNKQTGVPESKWPSYESVKKRFSTFESSCSATPGVCGSSDGNGSKFQKKVKLVEQFGDIGPDTPWIISTVILSIIVLCLVISIMRDKKK